MHIPIAAAASIQQAVPLVITFIGAIWLGEQVGWRRYTAIIIGFIGVLLIVRPGADSFNVYVMFSVAGVMFLVLRDLSTRQFSADVSSLFVALVGSLLVTVSSGVLSLFETWQPLTWPLMAGLAAAAGFIFFGYLCGVMTMRVGEIAFVSPFRYTVLIWAALLGYLVFDEVPDNYMLLGGLVIAMAGVYSFTGSPVWQQSPEGLCN
ncbi:DMT family transporter [Aliamphritea spongicola]|nr:DMT family transporter [Aliamphritea spongicola]